MNECKPCLRSDVWSSTHFQPFIATVKDTMGHKHFCNTKIRKPPVDCFDID